ncbi:hypothetical protein GCM10007067_24380 [Lysobacter bugurensis]|uniref:Uncharacterized protein n=1 Tax=Cognatilysobacter bugurensis TaxID=543356 RepID=A0A918T5H9_9GAMM|nr:hypothetical protein GCM10007067_24380 [Lysobacter bugurensis]
MSAPDRSHVNHEAPDEPGRARAEAELPENRGTLWMLTTGPTVWAAHLLVSYVTVAIWCAKTSRLAPLGTSRTLVIAYTGVSLALIAFFGWRGWRQHRWGAATLPHDAPSAADRHRFLGFSTLLLCGLSFIAVVYQGLTIVFIGTCR